MPKEKRILGSIYRTLAIAILLFSFLLFHAGSIVHATNAPTTLTVHNANDLSSSITDPYLVAGFSFNVSILATNLPTLSGPDSGGISGFDITLDYNSSVLRAVSASFATPRCPLSENCIFGMPSNDTIVIHQSVESPAGTTRVAVIGLGPSHRPDLSILQGQPAVLFRVQFAVAGIGLTHVAVNSAVTELMGFIGGCGNLLPFTSDSGFVFDNRAPFTVSASPASGTVVAGHSFSVLVNVSLVNSAGYGVVNLTLSNYVPPLYTKSLFTFNPVSGNLNGSPNGRSFTSRLTINTNSSTPLGTYILTIIGVIPVTPFSSNYFQKNLDFPLTIAQVSPTVSTTSQSSISKGEVVPQNPVVYSPSDNTSSLLASFTISNALISGSPVIFAAVSVWCSSPPYTLHWDFGDGSTGSTNPASHSYVKAGIYTVTLSIVDAGGSSYSSSQQVSVGNPQQSSRLDPVIISSVIILFLLLAIVFLLLRRRSRSRRT